MKKYLYLLSTLLISAAIPALAQTEPMVVSTATKGAVTDPVMEQIKPLQDEWARIKYQVADKDAQLAAIEKLESQAAQVTASNPARAEPKIWEAIILSTDAGITKGMSALPKVERAKALLEMSEKINPNALDGSAHTSLGSLYYQVPGWPVGFGDDKKAEEHLKMGLQINPDGIDANYFYGDFLLQDNRAEEAKTYLNRALQAPDREGRALADAGRRQEAKAALAKADETLKSKKRDFN